MIRKCLNGEMLLTILSSLAQEEVESLSSNVKMGLQMVVLVMIIIRIQR